MTAALENARILAGAEVEPTGRLEPAEQPAHPRLPERPAGAEHEHVRAIAERFHRHAMMPCGPVVGRRVTQGEGRRTGDQAKVARFGRYRLTGRRRPTRLGAMESNASPLVGRVAELAAVERLLIAARSAPAAVLEVVGEPGIGKTRLLSELAVRAERGGLRVHSGRGGELERGLPFGLVVDALDGPLAALDPGQLNRLGAEARAQLGGVFPALESPGSEPSGLSAERYRTHYAIRALLELLARRRPLVLALDDVHWADDASLELLVHLVRHPPHAPLAVVMAYRPAQAPTALTAAVLDGERAGVLERIALGPLTAGESDELLGGRLDAARRRALYRDSGGNPFYIEQLARAADHARLSARAAATDPGVDPQLPDVPRIVLSALGEEVAALSERVRVTARAAAVAGEAFGPRLVADIAGAGYQDVLADVDTLIDCDLIRPATAAQFRFRHPIVRRAVYESAPAAWLVGAHTRAALALEAIGGTAVA
ncbi:MAG: ATP-binding protein, partial [Solirubrobacteraceae bacterium]